MKNKIKKFLGTFLLAICIATPITTLSSNITANASITFGATVICPEGLNVRKGPSTSYSKISGRYRTLPEGTSIRVDDRDGNWVHITYPASGWVYAGVNNCNIVFFDYND